MRAANMLVISRRKGQRIAIGDDIEIVITEVHRSSVKLGIRAPRGYTVLRGEVSDAISAANREAASITLERAGELAGGDGGQGKSANFVAERLGLRRQPPDAAASQSRDAGSTAASRPSKTPVPSEGPVAQPSAVATPKPGGP
jgi:carbon storage regulator